MSKVIRFPAKDLIAEHEMSPAVIFRILKASGLDAQLQADGAITVDWGPRRTTITVADHPTLKLFYSATWEFKPALDLMVRLKAANKLNQQSIGAAHVDEDSLMISSTLSFEGGILPHNIANSIRDFISLTEDFVASEVEDEIKR